MSWTYVLRNGRLISPKGGLMAVGYSGAAGVGKDNPAEVGVRNVGPIPEGWYTVEPPVDSPKHGPYALALRPDAGNDMHGRDAFMIHGDSIGMPGTASRGCIVLPRFAREAIWNGGDHRLTVVREQPVTT
jgi:hypothetical protein